MVYLARGAEYRGCGRHGHESPGRRWWGGETSVQALADHGGISLRPISADRFSAQVRDLFCEPPGKLLAELDLKDDTFYCASWVPREEHCVAVSGMISRLLGVYELAMVERPENIWIWTGSAMRYGTTST